MSALRPVVIRLVALVLAVCGIAAQPSAVRRLTILHTNDLHATLLPTPDGTGGFAHLASAIKGERARAGASILLDGGDLVQGSPVSTLFEGVPMFEFGNLLGIDAAAIGNHEFDYGWQRIAEFQKTARYPLLAANVVNDAGQMLTPPGYVIKTAGGIRIGIIGAMTALTDDLLRPRHLGPWRSAPVASALAPIAKRLKLQVDLVIVVAHLDHTEDREILERVPEVAIVISGHNHAGRPAPLVIDGRVGVKLRSNGRELGRFDLGVDTVSDALAAWDWKAIPIGSRTHRPDPAMATLVAAWEQKVSALVDVPIGRAASELGGESLRLRLQRGLAAETGADIAYLNAGGIRNRIRPGTILARDIWNVLPFDNRVVIAEARGAEFPREVRADHALDASKVYRLATLDFLAETTFSRSGLTFGPPGEEVRDAIIRWVRKRNGLD